MKHAVAVIVIMAAAALGWWMAGRGQSDGKPSMPAGSVQEVGESTTQVVAAKTDGIKSEPQVTATSSGVAALAQDPYPVLTGRGLDEVLEIRPGTGSLTIPPLPRISKLTWQRTWLTAEGRGSVTIVATGVGMGEGAESSLRLETVVFGSEAIPGPIEAKFEAGVLKISAPSPIAKPHERELLAMARQALLVHRSLPQGQQVDGVKTPLGGEMFQLSIREGQQALFVPVAKLGSRPDRTQKTPVKPGDPVPVVAVYPAEPGNLTEMQITVAQGRLSKVSRILGKRSIDTGDWDLSCLTMTWPETP